MTDNMIRTEVISQTTAIVFVCIALFVIFLSLLCNIIAMTTILSFKEAKSPKDWLIMNIVVCNMVSAICSTFSIDNVFMEWNIWEGFCKISYGVMFTDLAVTILSLFVLSVERYYGICCSVEYQKRSVAKKVKWSIPGIILLSVGLYSVYFVIYSRQSIHTSGGETRRVCAEKWPFLHGAIFDTVVSLGLFTVIGSVVITFILIKILQKLSDSRTPLSGGSAVLNMKRKFVIKMIFAMLVAHNICWIPTILLKTISGYANNVSFFMLLCFGILPHARSIIFFFTYCALYSGFVTNIKSMCCSLCCLATDNNTPRTRGHNTQLSIVNTNQHTGVEESYS